MADLACRACGADVAAGMAFCGQCGTRAAAVDVVGDVAAEPWACRECGGANPAGSRFCGHCGGRWTPLQAQDLRMVTALFADISGFTTLADSLPIEDLHDVINPLIRGLARIAERYDGFIEKYAGDALLVVYGAPVAHEDDPQRALLTALDMHDSLPRLLAEIGPAASELTIHIGVNTGRVVAGRSGSEQQADYTVLGDSVILAQRLESVCPSGQTYVGPMTYEMCREEYDFEPLGPLSLKGKVRPVEAYRLIGRRRAGTATDRPLVGRSAELQVVDSALADVASGTGRTLAFTGDPGVGKSRLLAETRARATSQGMRWLAARCLSYGASLPYWPFADLLRQALGLRIEDTPSVVRRRIEESLPAASVDGAERLLGVATAEVSPEQARRQTHDAIVAWIRSLAAIGPVAVSVEDVHWADTATVELLAELVRATRGRPVAVVLSARKQAEATLDQVADEQTRVDVPVEPLGPPAVADLVDGVLGKPPGSALLALLVERTGGNPLFAEELTRSLSGAGALVETSSTFDLRPTWNLADVPRTVENVFAARLDQLTSSLLDLLQHSAVLGRTARLSVLRAVMDDVDIAPAVDDLVGLGLLDRVVDSDEHAVAFHHALLHDVVYRRILRKRRRRLHRKMADVGRRLLGDGDEMIGFLAEHLYLADAGDEAVGPLLRAGRHAERLFANDTAVVHLTRALDVLGRTAPEDARTAAVRLELARVHELRGDYDSALELFEQAHRDSGRTGVEAWRGCASVLRKKGQVAESLAVLDDGLADSRLDVADLAPLFLEKAAVQALEGRSQDAIGAAEAGLAVCRDDALGGELLLRLARAEEDLGRHDGALANAERARELFERAGDLRGLAFAYRILAGLLRHHDRNDDAADAARRGLELAERVGSAEEVGGCLINLGVVELTRGNLEAAVSCNERAIELFERTGNLNGRATAQVNLAETLAGLGRRDEALQHAMTGLELATAISATWTAADAHRTIARVHLDAARYDDAASSASEAAVLFDQVGDQQSAEEARALGARASSAGLTSG
ncbi:MAG TPA: adenylate/guanylate cyclase domain-containing protein [Mycobacteriales bacterium]|nr:adenylate/guanylate cyclase domain-containing protein [Mycobacteriales bacterium]